MNGLILAIDLGECNSVCCWYDTSTKSATFRHARTTRADLGRDLTRQPVLGVVVTQVERNFSNEADVVLTKAGPGLVCDPGGRPVAVTANSRVNPESSNVRIATRKNRRRTVSDCGIIVEQAQQRRGTGELWSTKTNHAPPSAAASGSASRAGDRNPATTHTAKPPARRPRPPPPRRRPAWPGRTTPDGRAASARTSTGIRPTGGTA